MSIIGMVESVLFAASKPVSVKKIAEALNVSEVETLEAIEKLLGRYSLPDSGMRILRNESVVQMVTNPDYSEAVDKFTKSEITGDLTPAQLETLTVVAYQQPVTRPELEKIRGVNCAVILRNLLQRGLIEDGENSEKFMPVYNLSIDALRYLGISSVKDLPDYKKMHNHDFIRQTLDES